MRALILIAALCLCGCSAAYSKAEIDAAFAERDKAIETLADAILKFHGSELPDPK